MAMALAVVMTSCGNDFTYPPLIMEETKGDGTAENPYNIAKAVRVAAANGETSNDFVFVAGYVVSGSIDTSYGNATFDLYDSPDGSGQKLIAYRIKGFNDQKFTDANQIKVGDGDSYYIVIYAPLIYYNSKIPETGTGGYLYSINGEVGSTIVVPDTPTDSGTPAGAGTAEDPYNVAKAIEVAKANGETSETYVYTEGYVISGSIDTSYGNGTWEICDKADGTSVKMTVYRAKDLGDTKFTDPDKVKVGDKIVVYAPVINFKGNTPETNLGYLYSINGQTGGTTPDTPDTPASGDEIYSGLVSNMDGWNIDNVTMPSEVTYIWKWDESYKNLKASAYVNSTNYATESIVYTTIDLSNYTAASTNFDHAYKFGADIQKSLTFEVRENGKSEWTTLTIPTWPTGQDWTFVNSGVIDLKAYAGKKIDIGFRYTSTSSAAATWEIKNFKVNASK